MDPAAENDEMQQIPPHLAEVIELFEDIRKAEATGARPVLIFSHEFGGGAESYRLKLVDEYMAAGHEVVSVSYSLGRKRYRVIYYEQERKRAVVPPPRVLFKALQSPVFDEIVVNNILFFPRPLRLLDYIVELKEDSGARLIFPVHDYFCLCPTCVLLDDRHRFCDLPSLRRCAECMPNNTVAMAQVFPQLDMRHWRQRWVNFLNACDRIIAFSQASIDLIARLFPRALVERIELIPHKVDYMPDRKPRIDSAKPLNIGVVGRINMPKGADLLAEMADLIETRGIEARITIIGNAERPMPSPVIHQTGRYEHADLPDLIEANGVNLFFFSSVWPETFSFVVDELMQLGVPLAAFDIGAPAERIAAYEHGRLIGEIGPESALDALIDFHEDLKAAKPARAKPATKKQAAKKPAGKKRTKKKSGGAAKK